MAPLQPLLFARMLKRMELLLSTLFGRVHSPSSSGSSGDALQPCMPQLVFLQLDRLTRVPLPAEDCLHVATKRHVFTK